MYLGIFHTLVAAALARPGGPPLHVHAVGGDGAPHSLLGDRFEDGRLEAADTVRNGRFGISLAADGDTLAVGTWDGGVAHAYIRDGATWTRQAVLVPSGGARGDYGNVVALSGDTVAVSAEHEDDMGAVYVFMRSGTTWTEQARLVASDRERFSNFGGSLAIDGDTIIVGAHLYDGPSHDRKGAAYVFVRSGGTWTEQARLTASDPSDLALFGFSVAVSGDTALIGIPRHNPVGSVEYGAVYVLQRTGTAWREEARLFASDRAVGDWFGSDVGLSGPDLAIIASPNDDDDGPNAGAAYIFRRGPSGWAEEAKLRPAEAAAADGFGSKVAIRCNTALIGAVNADIGGSSDVGVAYLFEGSGSGWLETSRFLTSDGVIDDNAGQGAVLFADLAAIGVGRHDGHDVNTGAVDFYSLTPSGCGPCSPAAIGPIERLRAVRAADDVHLSWEGQPAAHAYDAWWVTVKDLIPLASAAGGAGASVPGCLLVTATNCTHLGAVPASGGTVLYYQLIGACGDGTEAPE